MSTTTNFSKIPNSLIDGSDRRLTKINNKNSVLVYLIFTNTHLEYLQWTFSYPEVVEFCKTIGIKTRIRMLLDDLIESNLISYDEETSTYYAPDVLILQDETMQRYRNERYSPHSRAKKTSKLHDKKLVEWQQHPRPKFVEKLTGRPEIPYNTPRHNVSLILDSVIYDVLDIENPLMIIDPPEALPREPEPELDPFVDEMNEANPFHITELETSFTPEDLFSPPLVPATKPADHRQAGQEPSNLTPPPTNLSPEQKDTYHVKINGFTGKSCTLIGRMHIMCDPNGSPMTDRQTGNPILCTCNRQDMPVREIRPQKKEVSEPPRFETVSTDRGRYDALFMFDDEPTPSAPQTEKLKTFARAPEKVYKPKKKAPNRISDILNARLRADAK